MKIKFLKMGLLSLFLMNVSANAETFVQKNIKKNIQLVPLEKLTAGPYDNFTPALSSNSQSLYFTRKEDLIPKIYFKNLKTGKARSLFKDNYDSREPILNYNSSKILFVYYKNKPGGELCIFSIDNDEINCLNIKVSGEIKTPFWLNQFKIGFLLKDLFRKSNKIMTYDILSQKLSVLDEGYVYSPTSNKSRKKIVYLKDKKSKQRKNTIVVLNIETGKKESVNVDLPGLSGSPHFSQDEEYIYFSQFLNDTNYDQIIDGNDNSVIFRKKLMSKGQSKLEQLTSAENNCSYPLPSINKLLMTCAYEGSLDIYQSPLTGVVPRGWTVSQLWEAHKTSRTYRERLLLLNAIALKSNVLNKIKHTSQIMSNHLYADDLSASEFYLNKLMKWDSQNKDDYKYYKLFIEGRRAILSLRNLEVTPRFKRRISKLEKRLYGLKKHSSSSLLLKANFKTYIDEISEAQNEMNKASKLIKQFNRFDWYIYLIVSERIFKKNKKIYNVSNKYLNYFVHSYDKDQGLFFHAYRLLKNISQSSLSIEKRIQWIDHLSKRIKNKKLNQIFLAEKYSYQIIRASGKKEKRKIYSLLDKLMSKTRNDYFLRRTLYVRSILNFAQHDEFIYLSYVATSWLKYTQKRSAEFTYAREQFTYASLDRAYDNYANHKVSYAESHFYGSLRLTDDLESHAGYIKTMLEQGQKKRLDASYKDLLKRNFLDENIIYVNSLMSLLLAQKEDGISKDNYEDLISELNELQANVNHPLKHLLAGYSYLELFLMSSKGLDIERSYFEKAHKELMLALDLGRENRRIKASALENLSILHQRAQNHGLAVKFLKKRVELGYSSDFDKFKNHWLLSKSLFYINDFERALNSLETIKVKSSSKYYIPYLDRKAFLMLYLKKYNKSLELYEIILKDKKKINTKNLMSLFYSKAYALFKLNRKDQARVYFLKAIQKSNELNPEVHSKEIMGYKNKRITLLSYGFLAQISHGKEKIEYLEHRLNVLDQIKYDLTSWGLKLEKWEEYVLKAQLQLSHEYFYLGNRSKSQQYIKAGVQVLLESLKDNPVYISQKVLNSLGYYYIWSLKSKVLSEKLSKDVNGIFKLAKVEYEDMKKPSQLIAKKWELIEHLKNEMESISR